MRTPLLSALLLLAWLGPAWAGPILPRQTGIASWYGYHHNGRPTANGERLDPDLATAAHRSLPLGSIVRVTNLSGGATVVVRINDRGPYVRGRIIDLSEHAARALGLVTTGLGTVLVEVLVLPGQKGTID